MPRKITEVPWSELFVGRRVKIDGQGHTFTGVIARLEQEPIVWITWDDGNKNAYNQSQLFNVMVLDEVGAASDFDAEQFLAERESWGENSDGE